MTLDQGHGANTDAEPPNVRPPSRPWLRALQVLGLLLTIFMIYQNGLYFRIANGTPNAWLTGTGLSTFEPCGLDHFCAVPKVRPNSSAERAGIKPGDTVRYDRAIDAVRSKLAGERVGMTVRHEGGLRHVELTAEPRKPVWAPTYMTSGIVIGFVALLGGLCILRGWRNPAALMLGLAFVAYSVPGNYPRLWQNAPDLYMPFFVVLSAMVAASTPLLLAAGRLFRREATGEDPVWVRWSLWGCIALQALVLAEMVWAVGTGSSLAWLPDPITLQSFAWSLGAGLVVLVFDTGWFRVLPAERTRCRFMLTAVCLMCIQALVDPMIMVTGKDYVNLSWPVVAQFVGSISGALLFAYAVLRHRVVDLGFAVNRTLVYGVLSTVLLLAFGLAEKGIEKLLPFEHHEANALASAGVALAIFLVFHHVRDFVEHAVQQVFFKRWRDNEARLKRFVKEAAFVTRRSALLTSAIAEFGRFSGGAKTALYQAADTAYERAEGGADGLGETVDADLPVLVRLRAERTALDHDLPGGLALILPIVHRSEVSGFFALGPKPAGEPYRPDEIAALADAAQKIGQDLQVLRIDQQAVRLNELEQHNSQLKLALSLVRGGDAPLGVAAP
jgi:hypothetical protein